MANPNYSANINAAMGMQGAGTPEEQRLAEGLRGQQQTADFLSGSTILPQQAIGQQMNERIGKGAQQYGQIQQAGREMASREEQNDLDRAQRLVEQTRDFQGRAGLQFSEQEHNMLRDSMQDSYATARQILAFDQDTASNEQRQGYAKELKTLDQTFAAAERKAEEKFRASQSQLDREQLMAIQKMRDALDNKRYELDKSNSRWAQGRDIRSEITEAMDREAGLKNESGNWLGIGESDRFKTAEKRVQDLKNIEKPPTTVAERFGKR